jgi:hypothetical protein
VGILLAVIRQEKLAGVDALEDTQHTHLKCFKVDAAVLGIVHSCPFRVVYHIIMNFGLSRKSLSPVARRGGRM